MIQKRVLVVAVTVVALVLIGGCGSSSKKDSSTTTTKAPDSSNTTAAAAGGSSGDAVQIKGFAFKPDALKVKTGTKVTWTNDDSADHTATSTKGPASFDSKNLGDGKAFSFTFAKAGTYEYHCDIHNSMTGTVDVS